MKNKTAQNKKLTFLVVATGQYNGFLKGLLTSALNHLKFDHEFIVFSDDTHKDMRGIAGLPNLKKIVPVKHYGWPKMPLVRFELYKRNLDLIDTEYVISIDSEAKFVRNVREEEILGERIGCLHRNITRQRKDFNYESRKESMAYIAPDEGERYYACGLVGGRIGEFRDLTETIAYWIHEDIKNGIRAIWGDESHLNRYFVDKPPTKVLPPNYMCPVGNPHFKPSIIHRHKEFKTINIGDTSDYMEVRPEDYEEIYEEL